MAPIAVLPAARWAPFRRSTYGTVTARSTSRARDPTVASFPHIPNPRVCHKPLCSNCVASDLALMMPDYPSITILLNGKREICIPNLPTIVARDGIQSLKIGLNYIFFFALPERFARPKRPWVHRFSLKRNASPFIHIF